MRIIKTSSLFVAVFLGMFIGSARAQGIVIANVPFSFLVGHQEFPAGQYEIRNADEAGATISIEGVNNRSHAFALTMPAAGGDPVGDQPVLVFSRDENGYQLAQIWDSSTQGRALQGVSVSAARAATDARMLGEPSDPQAYVLGASWK